MRSCYHPIILLILAGLACSCVDTDPEHEPPSSQTQSSGLYASYPGQMVWARNVYAVTGYTKESVCAPGATVWTVFRPVYEPGLISVVSLNSTTMDYQTHDVLDAGSAWTYTVVGMTRNAVLIYNKGDARLLIMRGGQTVDTVAIRYNSPGNKGNPALAYEPTGISLIRDRYGRAYTHVFWRSLTESRQTFSFSVHDDAGTMTYWGDTGLYHPFALKSLLRVETLNGAPTSTPFRALFADNSGQGVIARLSCPSFNNYPNGSWTLQGRCTQWSAPYTSWWTSANYNGTVRAMALKAVYELQDGYVVRRDLPYVLSSRDNHAELVAVDQYGRPCGTSRLYGCPQTAALRKSYTGATGLVAYGVTLDE